MRICLMNGYANKSDLIRDGKEYRTLKSRMYNTTCTYFLAVQVSGKSRRYERIVRDK